MITTPTENIKSLEQLEASLAKQVAARQDSVTVLDADIIRLKKLVEAEKYTIGEQSKQKDELEIQISKLEDGLKVASDSLESINEAVVAARDELTSIQAAQAEALSQKAEAEGYIDSKYKELSSKQAIVDESARLNAEKADELAQKETAINAKHAALAELASKLN